MYIFVSIISTGFLVYNYDENGVHIDDNLKWPMCIAVNMLDILKGHSASVAFKQWDETLNEHSNKSVWTIDKYGLVYFIFSISFLFLFISLFDLVYFSSI